MHEKLLRGGSGGGGAWEAADRRLPDPADPGVLNALLVEGSIGRCCGHLMAGV